MEDSNRSANADIRELSDPARRLWVQGGLGGLAATVLAGPQLTPMADACVAVDRASIEWVGTAAEARAVRLDYREGCAHGNRGVEGVAACSQSFQTGNRGCRMGRGASPSPLSSPRALRR